MTSEAQTIVRLAQGFLTSLTRPYGLGAMKFELRERDEIAVEGNGPLRGEYLLSDASERVSELLNRSAPSAAVLEEVGQLFDSMAAAQFAQDTFGEASEICSTLAFLGWRHASALGLEAESQKWISASDRLARESFVALDCIQAFIQLPMEQQTTERFKKLMNRPEDVFIALASLRRDRGADPSKVLRAATVVYRASQEAARSPFTERSFFSGEAAWLIGNSCRYLGRRVEASSWLHAAARHFRETASGNPLLSRAQLALCVLARDRHDLQTASQGLMGLATSFEEWGMKFEVSFCRMLTAVVAAESGDSTSALLEFEQLVGDLRRCDSDFLGKTDVLGTVLTKWGELLAADGEMAKALEVFEEAAIAVQGKPLAQAWLLLAIAESHLNLGNVEEAVRWCEAGVSKSSTTGSTGYLAYFRVWFADVLFRAECYKKANEQLILALPVLRAEKMFPEAVHAANLMARIDSRRLAESSDQGHKKRP